MTHKTTKTSPVTHIGQRAQNNLWDRDSDPEFTADVIFTHKAIVFPRKGLTAQNVREDIGPEGLELVQDILCHCRASRQQSHQWVDHVLRPKVESAIVAVKGATSYLDGAHNLIVTMPGDDTTMFTAHTDTVIRSHEDTQEVCYDLKERVLFKNDGKPLGADDGTGIAILLSMIRAKIPGIYAFFADEETGGIGSRHWKGANPAHVKKLKRVISFDRKANTSVITRQAGGICCSTDFANALAAQLSEHTTHKFVSDQGGTFTDSAVFIHDVAECTNVSVGYLLQHTQREIQNIQTFEELSHAARKVSWAHLPTVRKPTPAPAYSPKPNPPVSKAKAVKKAPVGVAEFYESMLAPNTDVIDLAEYFEEKPYLAAFILANHLGVTLSDLEEAVAEMALEHHTTIAEEYDLPDDDSQAYYGLTPYGGP